jgi:hypothetical protein
VRGGSLDGLMGASVGEFERGAARVSELLAASCAGQTGGFAERVRAALSTVLELLAAEPELARLLVVEPYEGDRTLLTCHWSWLGRCAASLRAAACEDPDTSSPAPFLEPALLRAIRWQVAAPVLVGRPAQLPELAPDISSYVLSYYLPPASGAMPSRGLLYRKTS